MRWLDDIIDSMYMNLRKLQETKRTEDTGALPSMGLQSPT